MMKLFACHYHDISQIIIIPGLVSRVILFGSKCNRRVGAGYPVSYVNVLTLRPVSRWWQTCRLHVGALFHIYVVGRVVQKHKCKI